MTRVLSQIEFAGVYWCGSMDYDAAANYAIVSTYSVCWVFLCQKIALTGAIAYESTTLPDRE